ncbi:hypothetical protein ACIPLC_16380 [Kitasatospora sp. NPDC086801]|uniref:hypothetical protein n=1 Tax=Kitasatospora sp. NPDC086801 TaxID=3364066 RepID=UPI0037FD705F
MTELRELTLAEARPAAAEDTSQLPPLLRVPTPVKGTWPVAGLPFTGGSAVFADRIAPADAVVVGAQLEQARPWLHHTPQPVLDRDAAHRDTAHRDTAHRGLAFQVEGGTT